MVAWLLHSTGVVVVHLQSACPLTCRRGPQQPQRIHDRIRTLGTRQREAVGALGALLGQLCSGDERVSDEREAAACR